MLKRVISVAACLMMLAATLTSLGSCGLGGGGSDTEVSQDVVQSSSDTDTYVPPDVNYGGQDFNVFTWTGTDEWVMEFSKQLTDVDRESFYHLANVENELGIKFNIAIKVDGGYYKRGDFVNKINMLSGDDKIDLVCQYSLTAAVGTQQGVYQNLLDVDYLRWDAEYWSQDLVSMNTINNKMFYCTGDLTPTVLESMFIMVFNYDLAETNQMGDLYELVDNTQWTIEKLYELTKGVRQDVNNDGAKDTGDNYGIVVSEYNTIDAYQYGGDLDCLVTNSLGELEVNPQLYGEYGTSLCDKLKQLLHSNPGAYCNTKDNEINAFAMRDGKTVFQVMLASDVISVMNKSNINYGILPIPMYDTDQESYRTTTAMIYSMFSIPVIARDADMSGAVLESMAHSGHVKLNPAIFEALQNKYTRRVEDKRMFDILHSGLSYDPGRILDTVDIFALVRRTVRDNTQITTYYAEGKEVFDSGLVEVNLMFS